MSAPKLAPGRRPAKASVTGARAHRAPIAAAHFVDDAFFRHLVAHMRNGVLAINRAGELVLINDEACRIFGLPAGEGYLGRPFAEVFHAHPGVVRVLAGAYELAFLPNRAELRLTPADKVLGYTLSLIRNSEGMTIGAAMFFKDLTRVEQLEERERLRDRLAALGEMAAAVAHEIKNPLAGIEVMAGLLRRQLRDNAQATALVGDIISEAKMANAIVQEILDFVRPVRLEMERTAVGTAIQSAVTLADSKGKRGAVEVRLDVAEGLPMVDADRTQLVQVFANLIINAYEAMAGSGTVTVTAREVPAKRTARWRRTACTRCQRCSSTSATPAPACRPSSPTRFSAPSSRPSRRGRASAWPSDETLTTARQTSAPFLRPGGIYATGKGLRLQTIVRLRWLAVVGQALAVLFVAIVLNFPFPLGWCLAVIALSAWLNMFLTLRWRTSVRLHERYSALLLAYDIVQLAALLFLTGGLLNPFAFLFIVPVAVSAATLPPNRTLWLGGLALVLAAILAFFRLPLPWYGGATFELPTLYMAGSLAGDRLLRGLLGALLGPNRLPNHGKCRTPSPPPK